MKNIFKQAIAIILLAIIISAVLVVRIKAADIEDAEPTEPVQTQDPISQEVIKQMNTIEKHYDARGPFILIDRYHCVTGYYMLSRPLGHQSYYPINKNLQNGVYYAHFVNDAFILYDINGCIIHTWQPASYLGDDALGYFSNLNQPFPVVVYSYKYDANDRRTYNLVQRTT